MSLFIKQDNQRSELQTRIAAELQEKSRLKSKITDRPDGIDDSQYIVGTKKTTSLAGVWVAIVFIAIVIALWLMILSLSQS